MSHQINISEIISNLKSSQAILKTSSCMKSCSNAGYLLGSVLGSLLIPVNTQTMLETEFTEDNILKAWPNLPEDVRKQLLSH